MVTLLDNILKYETEDFIVYTEEEYGQVHIHCLVYNWKLSVLKNLYLVFGEVMNILKNNGVTELYSVTPNPKFAKMFGGSSEASVVLEGGVIREVIVWRLE